MVVSRANEWTGKKDTFPPFCKKATRLTVERSELKTEHTAYSNIVLY